MIFKRAVVRPYRNLRVAHICDGELREQQVVDIEGYVVHAAVTNRLGMTMFELRDEVGGE